MHKNQGKKTLIKEELEIVCKESRNFAELQIKLGYKSKTGSNQVVKRLKKYLLLYNIDYSHFDSFYKLRLKRIHPIIEKECPICKNKFKTESGHRDEKTYCSKKCANSISIGNRHSKESIEKMKITTRLVRPIKPLVSKTCEFCRNEFFTKIIKRQFCSRKCQMKGLWLREGYRNNILSKIRNNVKSGKHKGWGSRNILSYPEKFFKKVLELNGFKDKFIINYPIKKRDLKIDCDSCYFLDFYFPELKLDLEIDGKQHKLLDRKESDTKRDIALDKHGYKVYRIDWKNLNTPKGKEYIKEEIRKFLEFINNL